MSAIYIQTTSADQWASLLADPVKHWRTGYSAKSLAYSWQEANGFPKEVRQALATSDTFRDLELLLALPEHQVPLPGGVRPSQNDVWVLARTGNDLVSIAVEGKVSEPFGPTIEEWFAEGSPGKDERLGYLRGLLGLPNELSNTVRYQLLHRTASALIEAERFCAKHAVMLVHSFSQSQEWFEDYAAFAKLLGVDVEPNKVSTVGERNGRQLHLCWVCGDGQYLSR